MVDCKKLIYAWLSNDLHLAIDSVRDLDNIDLLDSQILDSVQYVEMVSMLEGDCGILFSGDIYEDKKMRTISGLINKISILSDNSD